MIYPDLDPGLCGLAAAWTGQPAPERRGEVAVSLFAGIAGLDAGFEWAGWRTAVHVEWDKAARRVLDRWYPGSTKFGDVTEVTADAIRRAVGDRRVRLLYGGFPCTDLSVAGRRAGLAGTRSGLYAELVRLADDLDPDWLVVENVPGLLTADADPTDPGYGAGTAMALVLGDLTGFTPPVPDGGWRNSGVCTGPKRTVAWRVLDARHTGVAQRRRRVFLVAHPGDRAAPGAVLLEPEGVRGNPPPGEPPRPKASTRAGGAVVRGGTAAVDRGGADVAGAVTVAADDACPAPVRGVHARDGYLMETDGPLGSLLSRDDGAGASVNAQPLILDGRDSVLADPNRPVAVRGRDGGSQVEMGDEPLAHTLRAGDGSSSRQPLVLAYAPATDDHDISVVAQETWRKARRAQTATDDETWEPSEVSNTLNTFDVGDTRAVDVVVEADAFPIGGDALRRGEGVSLTPGADADGLVRRRDPGLGIGAAGDPAQTLSAAGPGAVGAHGRVRRLTPTECERLQGMPDGWTVTAKSSDSSRYKELGNAVCATVSGWLGWRIAAYEDGWRPT